MSQVYRYLNHLVKQGNIFDIQGALSAQGTLLHQALPRLELCRERKPRRQ